jgi:cyclase
MKLPSLAVAAARVCVAAALSALACLPADAQRIDYSKLEIKTTDLGHGVYLLGWQGGDSLILVGDDGVLLVDTSVAPMAEKIMTAIAKVSNKPIRLIINTHAHADHFGANEALAKAALPSLRTTTCVNGWRRASPRSTRRSHPHRWPRCRRSPTPTR